MHSTAPPGNNTTSHICAMIHSGEKRGGWESNDTGTIAEEWMNEGMNERNIFYSGWQLGKKGHKYAYMRVSEWCYDYEMLGTFYPRFRSLFRSFCSLCPIPPLPLSAPGRANFGMIRKERYLLDFDFGVITDKNVQVLARMSCWLQGSRLSTMNCTGAFCSFSPKWFWVRCLPFLPFIYNTTLNGQGRISAASVYRLYGTIVSSMSLRVQVWRAAVTVVKHQISTNTYKGTFLLQWVHQRAGHTEHNVFIELSLRPEIVITAEFQEKTPLNVLFKLKLPACLQNNKKGIMLS